MFTFVHVNFEIGEAVNSKKDHDVDIGNVGLTQFPALGPPCIILHDTTSPTVEVS
jgi:hypothetical protein